MKRILMTVLTTTLLATALHAQEAEDVRVAVYLDTTRGARSYGADGMQMALDDYDFDVELVPDARPETLDGFDVLVVPAIIVYAPGVDSNVMRDNVRAFARKGGGVLLSQESVGWRRSPKQGGFQGIGMFPELGLGAKVPVDTRNAWGPISLTPLVVTDKAHPICAGLAEAFEQQYDGCAMKVGAAGKAVINYAEKPSIRNRKYEELPSLPAVVVGTFGKGRVVLSGTTVGLDRLPREFEGAPEADMLRYFLNAVLWASGSDKWEPFDIEEDD